MPGIQNLAYFDQSVAYVQVGVKVPAGNLPKLQAVGHSVSYKCTKALEPMSKYIAVAQSNTR